MNNDIIKTVKLKIEGIQQFKDLNKNILTLADYILRINTLLEENNKKTQDAAKNAIDATKKQTKATKEETEALEEKIKKEQESLAIRIRNREETARYNALEKGTETGWQRWRKYSGISGYFKRMGDENASEIARLNAFKNNLDNKITSRRKILELEGTNPDDDKELKGLLEERKDLSESIGKLNTKQNRISSATEIVNTALKAIRNGLDFLGINFFALGKQTAEVVKGFIDLNKGIATFNTATSLITNADARQQQLRYGLSSAQNFAFSQAKTMLGINTDEDLMYMNATQRDRFLQYMEKYSQWYSKMDSSGVLKNIQEMQLEFKELKQEIGMEFLSWLATNKDTIMTVIKGLFEVTKYIAELILKVASFVTGSGTYTPLYSTNGSYNTNSNTITIYATTTNNNNGVAGPTERDSVTQNQLMNIFKETIIAL